MSPPLVHDTLDKQYHAILDEPVCMLGNKSPRAAAGTKVEREKVAEWLKYPETRSASIGADDPMDTYDFSWMWAELRVEDLRR
ncbi:hypothetical protein [Rhizobium sp. L51/94]|uniref:hypothetical protein n=1 Tax=Rhizobium sp. L51/94 TaxID=2819999 RepID=UPI00214CFAAE|nr:hypothetical protein [Rhizobium sp. L51/94]